MGNCFFTCGSDGRNADVRNLVIDEFHGHIEKLISHKEAGMVVNNIYRNICTPAQKLEFIQELYGPEFRLFKVTSLKMGIDSRVTKTYH